MHTMTETEATNEALLLMIRKARRLHPEAFADILSRLPEGAKVALEKAERAADTLRDSKGGAASLDYPAEPEDEDEE